MLMKAWSKTQYCVQNHSRAIVATIVRSRKWDLDHNTCDKRSDRFWFFNYRDWVAFPSGNMHMHDRIKPPQGNSGKLQLERRSTWSSYSDPWLVQSALAFNLDQSAGTLWLLIEQLAVQGSMLIIHIKVFSSWDTVSSKWKFCYIQ
jgi:hypothetical protein